jgi:hypothetical protein
MNEPPQDILYAHRTDILYAHRTNKLMHKVDAVVS